MLYNNVKAMMHIQGHIDSSKQQNIDLSDLTQCKHCYKQFDTPFEMQTHVDKVCKQLIDLLHQTVNKTLSLTFHIDSLLTSHLKL